MARPAERLRQRAQERWPGATVRGRGRSWIEHQHPTDPDRRMVDASVGPLHYGDAADQEIDTAWQPTSGTWQRQMLDAEYQVRAKESFNGAPLVEFTDRVSGETITFQPRQLEFNNDRGDVQFIQSPQAVIASVDDATMQWSGAFGPGIDFRWIASTAFLNKVLSINLLADLPDPTAQILGGGNPVLRLQWQMSYSTDEPYVDGVQWSGRQNDPITTFSEIEFRDDQGNTVFTLKPARVLDSSLDFPEVDAATRISRSGPNIFVEVRVPWSWVETAVFPVHIDPTVEPQVAASADDSWEDTSGANYDSHSQIHVRTTSSDYRWGAFRVALNVANAATIDNATISVVTDHPARDTVHADVLAEDVDSASAFSSDANHITGRIAANPTTASYNWSDTSDPGAGATLTTPDNSLDAIVQEVVDRAGWSSGNYIAIFLDPSAYDTGEFLWARSYDGTPADAPLLHVEYTEGGGTSFVEVVDETEQISDANVRLSDLFRIVSETVQSSETVVRVRTLVRTIGETLSISENILRARTLVRTIGETLSISEGISYLRAMVRVISETVQSTEAYSRARGFVRMIDEGLSISENTLRVRTLVRAIGETLSISENILRLRTLARVVDESVSTSESILRLRAIMRVISETVQSTEASSRARGFVRMIDEGLSISEGASRAVTLIRIADETLSISENILRLRALARVVDESVSTSESIPRLRAMVRAINESESISEGIVHLLQGAGAALVEVINESLSVAESSPRLLALLRFANETISTAEQALTTRNLVRTVAETLNISEETVRSRSMTRIVGEVVQNSELVARVSGFVRVINESISVTEVIQQSLAAAGAAIDRSRFKAMFKGVFKRHG